MKLIVILFLSAISLYACVPLEYTPNQAVDGYIVDAQFAAGRGDYEEAERIYQKVLGELQPTLDTKQTYTNYLITSHYYSRFRRSQGKLVEAKEILVKTLNLSTKADEHNLPVISHYIEIAEICSELNQYKEAKSYLDRALVLAKSGKYRNVWVPIVMKRLDNLQTKQESKGN